MVINEPTHADKIAVQRFQLISSFINEDYSPKERLAHMKVIASNDGPSVRTLQRFYKKYTEEGFEGLKPKEYKKEKGSTAITPEILEAAITLRRENPFRSVKDIIYILELRGDIIKGQINRSTLQYEFQQKGYSKKQMDKYIKSPGVATKRFRKLHRMTQIQSDFKYACFLPIGIAGKPIQVYWTAWIDNSTRMILYGHFYARQTFYEVEDSLRHVIEKYGQAEQAYIDNGKPYISKKLEFCCAKCGIKISHTPIYVANAKGCIERMNSTLNKFLSEATLEKYQTLDELNANYDAWIDLYYNKRSHSSIKEGSPFHAFEVDSRPLRFIDNKIIKEAFSKRITRKVNNDCTVSIEGERYDVGNINLIGFDVEIILDPRDINSVLVRRTGFEDIIASPIKIGEFIKKPQKTEVDNRSKINTTKSEILDAIRKKYATENSEFDLNLACKAATRNKIANERNLNTDIAYSMTDTGEGDLTDD
jgi:transposase InsO family protein